MSFLVIFLRHRYFIVTTRYIWTSARYSIILLKCYEDGWYFIRKRSFSTFDQIFHIYKCICAYVHSKYSDVQWNTGKSNYLNATNSINKSFYTDEDFTSTLNVEKLMCAWSKKWMLQNSVYTSRLGYRLLIVKYSFWK